MWNLLPAFDSRDLVLLIIEWSSSFNFIFELRSHGMIKGLDYLDYIDYILDISVD